MKSEVIIVTTCGLVLKADEWKIIMVKSGKLMRFYYEDAGLIEKNRTLGFFQKGEEQGL